MFTKYIAIESKSKIWLTNLDFVQSYAPMHEFCACFWMGADRIGRGMVPPPFPHVGQPIQRIIENFLFICDPSHKRMCQKDKDT